MKESVSKEDPPWPAEHVVRNSAGAAVLMDLKAVRLLSPFLKGPRTLTEAAAERQIGTSTMAYWIKKFERAGLIVRLAPLERPGMAMPRYRAPARQLFLPFSAVPPGATAELLDRSRHRILNLFLDGLDEVVRHVGHTGLNFRAAPDQGVEIDIREPPVGARVAPWADFWGSLNLSRERAVAFAAELEALVANYREFTTRGTEYVVHVGLAPMPKRRLRSIRDA